MCLCAFVYHKQPRYYIILYLSYLKVFSILLTHFDCSFAVDHNYWALILILFPILTLFGNILVILSVCRERSLQTVTNYFIVSLAIADLLVAVVVMPFAVYFLVSLKIYGQPFGWAGTGAEVVARPRCQNQNAKCKIAGHLRLILSSVWGPSNK